MLIIGNPLKTEKYKDRPTNSANNLNPSVMEMLASEELQEWAFTDFNYAAWRYVKGEGPILPLLTSQISTHTKRERGTLQFQTNSLRVSLETISKAWPHGQNGLSPAHHQFLGEFTSILNIMSRLST